MSALHDKLVSSEELACAVQRIVSVYEHQQQNLRHANPMVREACVPRVLVAVAGRPGSGKSTIVALLADAVREALSDQPDPMAPFRKVDINDAEINSNASDDRAGAGSGRGVEVCVMPMDGYHLYRKELLAMPNAQEAVKRRGAEWTFNPSKLRDDLVSIRTPNERGLYDDVFVPSFDHAVGDPHERDIRIPGSAGVIIVEGNYVLYRGTPEWAAVNDMFDVKLFLACDRDVCTERLCQRHMKAWGVSRKEAMVRASGSDTINGDLIDTTMPHSDVVMHSINASESKL
ncbi:protein of unknown function - conserved [Leishmania donovani]|uniref:Hypothetical_protein_conserved n=1 Tax=Leishmania donovani TaxID=5661 RepID=A0A504XY10_LEIDO|nr:hypothetical protein CGC20_38425 [Leishmania donovani]CAJ1987370.1 protein of unknown function - conserved [Leishmania donovani]VDZ43259.1 hypothetical_protein_conserved [Leishmania donovani]